MTKKTKPPTIFGILLTVLGIGLLVGGLRISNMGGSGLYFIVVGLGVAASGGLIAAGKLLGIWLYTAVLCLMIVWSLAEEGANFQALLPRLALPIIFAVYMYSGKVKSRLS